jgi:hypothetical protein
MTYFEKFEKPPYKGKSRFGKAWYFIWHEDSIESWIINIILAFVLIKFIVYPGLGLAFGTTHPIVAVVSSSMHHDVGFDIYWDKAGKWYEDKGISEEAFRKFPMSGGFNKGDIMFLRGAKAKDVKVGDIIVFQARRPDPIIHRVVVKNKFNSEYIIQTKGDNYLTNPDSIKQESLDETNIREGQIIGKAFIRVPFLGYIKIWAVDFVCMFNNNLNFCRRYLGGI